MSTLVIAALMGFIGGSIAPTLSELARRRWGDRGMYANLGVWLAACVVGLIILAALRP